MFDSYREQLIGALERNGHKAVTIHAPRPPYRWDDIGCSYRETFPEDSCVIAHGDIELVTRVANERRWNPGAFCTVDNYLFSSYSVHLGSFLLNSEYAMLPFGELNRQREWLFNTFGQNGSIFVRPDSPLKLFTGQIAKSETFDADLEYMAFYEFPPSSLVVVSSPKQILAEWRFVIVNGRVVTGSEYKRDDKFGTRPDVDENARQYAETVAGNGYQPDPVWILDVCQTDDRSFHLLEIGGFSFADLYASDMDLIAKHVSEAAELVWKQKHA